MKYHDLRDFIAQLESIGELKRIGVEIDPRFEMTEICDRVLRAGGPALLDLVVGQQRADLLSQLAKVLGTDIGTAHQPQLVTNQRVANFAHGHGRFSDGKSCV